MCGACSAPDTRPGHFTAGGVALAIASRGAPATALSSARDADNLWKAIDARQLAQRLVETRRLSD